ADVIEPLKPLVLFLENKGYQAVICDSSDGDRSVLPLKLAAVRAGLGWQGKHSLLISKKFGTFLALGGIITNALLEHNTRQEANHCGNCDKCQKACPVNALDRSYKLTRGKCLSYLMQVEHLSEEAPDAMANRVADCEICQDVCPWNRKHIAQPLATKLTVTFQKKIRDWERFFYLPDLVKMSEQEYIQSTDKLRAGIPYDLFRRNVRIALRNAAKGG
ncbi:MAG: epoxyqueuosine reductase, partial [Candidatus Brocadiia bacterium]